MYTTENLKEFKPTYFKSEHEITLNNETFKYDAIAEDNPFYDKNGNPIASIYSYSYIRKDIKDYHSRPVMFCYNGGPGTSSMYVHLGFLAPKRIIYKETDRLTSLPPFEIKDNEECLLDIADIVCIDPVATGYGLLIDESKGKEFFSIEQDGEAILSFIQKWLTKYNRMSSPKYLFGESYGCTRNAFVAGFGVEGTKNRSYSIAFDGIINVGNTVTPNKYFAEGMPAEQSVLCFETYAATNYYHNKPSDKSLREFVKEAKEFASSEYMLALYKGRSLENKQEILDKVSYYTGLSKEYLISNDLKIDEEAFRREVIKNQGKAVSRLDTRITRPLFEPQTLEDKTFDDAMSDRYDPYFLASTVSYLTDELGVKMDRTYASYFNAWDKDNPDYNWSFEEKSGNTGEHLTRAMHKNFGMRVFFVNGYYDSATYSGYIDYLLNHTDLPLDRVTRKDYESGHMIYLGEDNTKELSKDVRDFLLGKMPSNE